MFLDSSYVTPDKMKTICIYDAPSTDAIRRAAARSVETSDCGELNAHSFLSGWLQTRGA